MKKAIYKTFVELTKNPIYTYILKQFTTSKLSKLIIPSFAKLYGINEEEMVGTIKDYHTLHDFFIRKLKDGARVVDEREDVVVSPVDGLLTEVGTIDEHAKFYVKGKQYSLQSLLGLQNTMKYYIGGLYMLFYLSPKDYHRIHSPIDGEVIKRWALGKYSEPVNQIGLLFGDQPLATNYRFITELRCANKRMALVKIGALNVNSIQTSHLHNVVKKGEELAYFSFGSSVILLFEKNMIQPFIKEREQNIPMKQGKPIGKFLDSIK